MESRNIGNMECSVLDIQAVQDIDDGIRSEYTVDPSIIVRWDASNWNIDRLEYVILGKVDGGVFSECYHGATERLREDSKALVPSFSILAAESFDDFYIGEFDLDKLHVRVIVHGVDTDSSGDSIMNNNRVVSEGSELVTIIV